MKIYAAKPTKKSNMSRDDLLEKIRQRENKRQGISFSSEQHSLSPSTEAPKKPIT
jgi:hypothetical protein